ncbi:hypothetical protein [uncultured Planktosalinus sp.]
MTTVKRMFNTVSEKKEDQQMNRRGLLSLNQKRDVWNSKRRFGY